MTSDTTTILNLTFVGTLMIAAFLAALVLFSACMALVFTGLGRLVYLGVSRLVGLGRNLSGRVASARQDTHDDASLAAATLTSGAANRGSGQVAEATAGTAGTASRTPAENGKSGLIPSWSKAAKAAVTTAETTPAPAKVAAESTATSAKPAGARNATSAADADAPSSAAGPAAKKTSAEASAGKTGQADGKALPGSPDTTSARNGQKAPERRNTPAQQAAASVARSPWKPTRNSPQPDGAARKTVPGILRSSQDSEEQHAKGA